MKQAPRIVGVHRIKAKEPVHLIEIDLTGVDGKFDWAAVTQPLPGKDQSYWQAAYDEAPVPNSSGRWRFFFHYLDLKKPLMSGCGELTLPPESDVPSHLRFVRYYEP